MTHPPTASKDKQEAVVLALHGAGVETSWSFWTEAVRPRERSWVVFPTGRTAWGYDWHGLSVDNVWSAKRQLNVLLQRLGKEALSDASVVIGHSKFVPVF
jgi:predicted esterase